MIKGENMASYDVGKLLWLCSNRTFQELKEYWISIGGEEDVLQKYMDVFEKGQHQYKVEDERIQYFLEKYETYLQWSFREQVSTEQCQQHLIQLYKEEFPNVCEWEEFEQCVRSFFQEKGYEVQFGIVLPYPDLYLWKNTNKRKETIEILGNTIEVNVHEMSDVIAGGWYDYRTFGKNGTGGWVSDDGIYYFGNRYDVSSDEFQVSLLKHEGQHVLDIKKYPEMESYDLEYRAKLVELIYYKGPERLYKFLPSFSDDKNNLHPYANKKVITELSKRIFNKELETDKELWNQQYEKVREVCRTLYEEHENSYKQKK